MRNPDLKCTSITNINKTHHNHYEINKRSILEKIGPVRELLCVGIRVERRAMSRTMRKGKRGNENI